MTNAEYLHGPIAGVSDEVMACIPHSGTLHAYVWWATQTTHAPAWWHVATGLTLVAHEAARQGFTIGELGEKPTVWITLLGPSAAGKSTAISRAIDFSRIHLEVQKARDPFVMAEGSIPGIFEKLTEGWDEELGRTIGVLHQEEFSRLLDRKDTVAEMLMQLIDGRDIERHKVSTRAAARQGQTTHDHLKNPSISAMFATTYSSLRRVTHGNHFDGGLYSRLLWFVADPDPEQLQMLPKPRSVERGVVLTQWQEWARWFLALEAVGAPRMIEVPEAVHWILEESLFETAKQSLKVDDRLNATRVRAVNQAYKIAGLFALSQGRLIVSSDDMDAAVNLVEKCTRGIERVDPELAGSELMQLINLGFRAIQSRGTHGLTRSELYPVLKSPKRIIEEVLGTLLDDGSVREVQVKTGKPGRPSTRYVACGPRRFTGKMADVVPLNAPITVPVDTQEHGE